MPLFPWDIGDLIPLLSDAHEDREIIGFPDVHYHVDWRFVTTGKFKTACWNTDSHTKAHARPINANAIHVLPIPVPRRCYRILDPFPGPGQAPWHERLADAYQHATATCDRCPHRGVSLIGAPVVDGARVCPGHGLAWNVETGKLQRRAK